MKRVCERIEGLLLLVCDDEEEIVLLCEEYCGKWLKRFFCLYIVDNENSL
jgi:hypothetical protein